MLCMCMVARATRITTKGCSQLPRIPQMLASSILNHVVCFQKAGKGWKGWERWNDRDTLHDVQIMWVQKQQSSESSWRETGGSNVSPPQLRSLPHSCTLGCPYCTLHLFWPFKTVQLLNAYSQWGHSWEASKHFSNPRNTNKETELMQQSQNEDQDCHRMWFRNR